MYKKILVPLDNSRYSPYCTRLAVSLAKRFDAALTGSHVYSANLHDRRFRDMEAGLPGHYREEERLRQSRRVHDSLIGDGLKMISDAYLRSFQQECRDATVPHTCSLREGKNWLELLRETRSGEYDLVILGILGLGAVNGNLIGSVCERLLRKVRADILIVKNGQPLSGRAVVAIDGSAHSFTALGKALQLSLPFGLKLEVVSAYDPFFHKRAFQALVGVLSAEAGKTFRFKEQEKLHDEIIDDGLGKIYQGYLDRAAAMAKAEGLEIETRLLTGKAYDEIIKYVRDDPPALLIAGRFGAHQTEEQDIGNTSENLLRLAPCNVLITGSSPD